MDLTFGYTAWQLMSFWRHYLAALHSRSLANPQHGWSSWIYYHPDHLEHLAHLVYRLVSALVDWVEMDLKEATAALVLVREEQVWELVVVVVVVELLL
jgi:hypothetical protein